MLPCKSALSNTMEKQYASMDSFLKRFDVPSRQMGFELITIEEFAVWKTVLRGELNGERGVPNATEQVDIAGGEG